ncbi:MAG: tetratricopeptide repeat protein [Fusobacteriaceae bacterium]
MIKSLLITLKVFALSLILVTNVSAETSEGNFYYGNDLMKKGQHEEANRVFKGCQEDERCLLGAATTSRLVGKNSEAIKYYNQLLNVNSEIEEGYFGRALAHRGIEEYNMAINDFKSALSKKDNEYSYAGLGDLYILIGRKDMAKSILEEGLKKYPNSKLIRELIVKTYN